MSWSQDAQVLGGRTISTGLKNVDSGVRPSWACVTATPHPGQENSHEPVNLPWVPDLFLRASVSGCHSVQLSLECLLWPWGTTELGHVWPQTESHVIFSTVLFSALTDRY